MRTAPCTWLFRELRLSGYVSFKRYREPYAKVLRQQSTPTHQFNGTWCYSSTGHTMNNMHQHAESGSLAPQRPLTFLGRTILSSTTPLLSNSDVAKSSLESNMNIEERSSRQQWQARHIPIDFTVRLPPPSKRPSNYVARIKAWSYFR